MRTYGWAATLLLLSNGCAGVAPVHVDHPLQAGPLHIVLIRGFRDWYSTGIDTLGATLGRDGFQTSVFPENQWRAVADALGRSVDRRPLVLVGFSYGADDVISIARSLHRPVQLLITIDPVTPAAVPANVSRCVNFYQPNGVWDAFPWLRGIPLHGDEGAPPLLNVNVRARPSLNAPNLSHATIAANRKIHAAIEGEIRWLGRDQ